MGEPNKIEVVRVELLRDDNETPLFAVTLSDGRELEVLRFNDIGDGDGTHYAGAPGEDGYVFDLEREIVEALDRCIELQKWQQITRHEVSNATH
jgi:hypothetical protein